MQSDNCQWIWWRTPEGRRRMVNFEVGKLVIGTVFRWGFPTTLSLRCVSSTNLQVLNVIVSCSYPWPLSLSSVTWIPRRAHPTGFHSSNMDWEHAWVAGDGIHVEEGGRIRHIINRVILTVLLFMLL